MIGREKIIDKVSRIVISMFMAAALAFATPGSWVIAPVTDASAVVQPGDLSYNSGHRDTVCTKLSSQALAYYKGEYSEDKLAKLTGDALYDSLNSLMSGTEKGRVTYKMLTKYFPYTDAEDGKAGTVLFYCDELPLEKTVISREHVWPKAHASFHEGGGGADLHHLRPTDSIVNSKRSSYIIGTVDKKDKDTKEIRYGDKSTGKIAGWWNEGADRFEPLDNVKGDMARILLYVYVRWEEPNLFVNDASRQDPLDKGNDGVKVIESLDTLLKWIEDDPVDTWEMGRNDIVEKVQGNRNVFIDHPEYAWSLFGKTAPESVKLSAGQGSGSSAPAATITSRTMKPGKGYTIRFTGLDASAEVKYQSSNTSVARVSKKGRIVAVSAGTATISITITQNGKKYTSKIKIKVTGK